MKLIILVTTLKCLMLRERKKKTSAPIKLFINCVILKNQVPVCSCSHTQTLQDGVCVFVFGCTRALCAPEGPDYMSCREMKSQWIDFLTQCTVFPCGHTHTHTRGCWAGKHTHNQRHTHIHTYSFPSWLVVLLSFWRLFFFFLSQQHYQLGMCVTCVYLCVRAYLCVSWSCAFKCVRLRVCAELR